MLARCADVFINDAFAVMHRAHASTTGVTKYLESAYGGLLVKKELGVLSQLLGRPKTPFVAILGGAKVRDKLGVINRLLSKVDCLMIGGAMAYTFLRAKGQDLGSSKVEEDKVTLAKLLVYYLNFIWFIVEVFSFY